MKRLRSVSLTALLAVTLAGCGASIGTNECRIFSPIRGSNADTLLTKNQIDLHNAKGVGACGWRP